MQRRTAHTTRNTNDNKADIIIEQAIPLFSEHGYDAVRISDITDGLSIGKGTFYLYFKDKRHLLMECFKQLSKLLVPLEQREEIRSEKDFFARMRKRWRGFAEQYSKFGGILHLLRTSCASQDADQRKKAIDSYDVIIEPLRRDLRLNTENGVVCNVDPELGAHFLFGAADALAFRCSLDSRYSVQDVTETFYRLVRKAFSVPAVNKPESANLSWILTDNDGCSTEVRQIRFGDGPFLLGQIGEGELSIDPSSIEFMKISQIEPNLHTQITSQGGEEINVRLDRDTIVIGETPLGTFRIPLMKVSSITFRGPVDASVPDAALPRNKVEIAVVSSQMISSARPK
jgi:AcrR family transcriptional regulator